MTPDSEIVKVEHVRGPFVDVSISSPFAKPVSSKEWVAILLITEYESYTLLVSGDV